MQNLYRLELMPTPFLQTLQGHLPSVVAFPAISLLIIIFVFLIFTYNLFECNAPFQAFNLPFRP